MDVWPPDVERPWRFLSTAMCWNRSANFIPARSVRKPISVYRSSCPSKNPNSPAPCAIMCPATRSGFGTTFPTRRKDCRMRSITAACPVRTRWIWASNPPPDWPPASARAARKRSARETGRPKSIFFSHNGGENERLQELLEEQLGSHGTDGMEFFRRTVAERIFLGRNSRPIERGDFQPRAPPSAPAEVQRRRGDPRDSRHPPRPLRRARAVRHRPLQGPRADHGAGGQGGEEF